jgi:methanogenic corrinoid protein MtbC1
MTDPIHSLPLAAFTTALLAMDRIQAAGVLASEGKARPLVSVVDALVVPALDDIGRAWDAGDVALSQVYMAAKICEELVGAVPKPSGRIRPVRPRIAMAALEDHHLLGKRIVLSMMRASGFVVADYGVLAAPALAAKARGDDIDVLLISVLMLRSALAVRALRKAFDALGTCPHLIVGGAPFRFDANLWREVGADACGRTASDAVLLVERFARAAA